MLGPFGHSDTVVAVVDTEPFVLKPRELSKLGKGKPVLLGVLEDDGEVGDALGMGVNKLSSSP